MPSEDQLKRRSTQLTVPKERSDDYMGSLSAHDISTFERRIAQIQRDLDELGVEDIKAHVLNNHILPLSRPGTPLSEFTRTGQLSISSYNRMEDLTAVITAIVVQALPNLARLSRLIQDWNLRLSTLRQVPSLLLAMEGAEVALASGWNAVSLSAKKTKPLEPGASPRESTLSRNDYNVMKLVLEKKISYPGRTLDYMLDCLEGLPDTLPDDWLDRMEKVERGYADWVATCERKVRETEWAAAVRLRPPRSPSPLKRSLGPDDSINHDESFVTDDYTRLGDSLVADDSVSDDDSIDVSTEVLPIPLKLPNKSGPFSNNSLARTASGVSEAETVVPDPQKKSFHQRGPSRPSFVLTEELVEPRRDLNDSFDGTADQGSLSSDTQPPTPTTEHQHDASDLVSHAPKTPNQSFSQTLDLSEDGDDDDDDDDSQSFMAGEESPELPPLRPLAQRTGDSLQLHTPTRESSSYFDGLSSDLPEISASPDLPRTRIREAEYIQPSPPSSPPMPPADSRESSLAPFDSPLLVPRTGVDDLLLETASVNNSFTDDFNDSLSISEFASPFDRRGSTGDQQLQQQISQIIDSIPAKIKLAAEPPAVNLNPPDLKLPRVRKRPSVEPFRRSASSLSSRAGTPSFTLSPAKNARPKTRGQQEIKVYHLSRSTGEAPIKLFIRCVGEKGERVMVRVGGGWADLGEYLKEYASHHKRRSASGVNAKVEVLPDVPVTRRPNMGSSPASRPHSAFELSPMTPLAVRKTRRSVGALNSEAPKLLPRTPAAGPATVDEGPSSEESNRSRSSSRLSWAEDDSSFLGLAGPSGKKVEMSEENKAWVESVKQKVRIASGERRLSSSQGQFGELGKVGGTKRLFKKAPERRESRGNLR